MTLSFLVKTAKQHLKHIQIVLTKLKQAKLMLKKSKCSFFKQELHYLGHLLTTNGIKPQTEKVKAISEKKPPKNQKGVKRISREWLAPTEDLSIDLLMQPGL